jgi:hypothetical protein
MSDIQLPPRRPLPPEVRSRIRTRALARPQPRRRTRFTRGRAPFTVAAGVAILAAGAVIIGQSVTGGGPNHAGQRTTPPTATTSAGRPLDLGRANAELDRCWAAIQAEGKADKYPARPRWRAVAQGIYPWVTVTAAFADGKPFFCQTTETTVRVSEPTSSPAYARGSKTAALLISPEGVIAGVRDESWRGVGIWLGDGKTSSGSTAGELPYGLFFDLTKDRVRDDTVIEVDRWSDDRDRAEHP